MQQTHALTHQRAQDHHGGQHCRWRTWTPRTRPRQAPRAARAAAAPAGDDDHVVRPQQAPQAARAAAAAAAAAAGAGGDDNVARLFSRRLEGKTFMCTECGKCCSGPGGERSPALCSSQMLHAMGERAAPTAPAALAVRTQRCGCPRRRRGASRSTCSCHGSASWTTTASAGARAAGGASPAGTSWSASPARPTTRACSWTASSAPYTPSGQGSAPRCVRTRDALGPLPACRRSSVRPLAKSRGAACGLCGAVPLVAGAHGRAELGGREDHL